MALGVESFSGFVQKGFAHAAFNTAAGMRDDEQVKLAARNMYDCIPFPVNIAIKMSVGVNGLERFALVFRDKLLAANITDLAQINPDDLRALLQKSIMSVPSLSRFITTKENDNPSELAHTQSSYIQSDIDKTALAGPDVPQNGLNGHIPPQAIEVKSWYLCRDDTRYGPWSDEDFLSFVEQGQLNFNDMVWREGFPDWLGVRELPALLANRDKDS